MVVDHFKREPPAHGVKSTPASHAFPSGLGARKPNSATAMRLAIEQMRASLPFEAPAAQSCTGICQDCAMKSLAFLAAELDTWEHRLNAGATPSLKDLSCLIAVGRHVHDELQRNGPSDP